MANFDSQISTQIKAISKCFVKPKYEVEASKQLYYLNPVDLRFLTLDPIQKGLLFPDKPNDIHDFLGKLKESLAIALIHFYPLAGQLSTEEFLEENADFVYLDCNKGPGALFIHAIIDCGISDILSSTDVHPSVQLFFDLGENSINYNGHTKPLLTIQVNELTDAIFVGFNISHSVADGNSEWHFINSLSEIFLQLNNNNDQQNNLIPTISNYPVFKPYFPDGCGPILKLNKEFLKGSLTQSNNPIILRERIFNFCSKSISDLKAKANEECGVHNISSFQALSAFIWQCITRARNLQSEDETCCGLVMDTRPRCKPPLTSDYFGNYLMRQQKICTVGELLSNGLGWASMLVHQLVASQDEKKVCEFYEMMVKFLGQDPSMSLPCFYNPNPILMGGSMRFDMYGPEFGFGKAVAVKTGSAGKADGKITVNPGPEKNGSVVLEVCLKPETMIALELDEYFMSFVTSM